MRERKSSIPSPRPSTRFCGEGAVFAAGGQGLRAVQGSEEGQLHRLSCRRARFARSQGLAVHRFHLRHAWRAAQRGDPRQRQGRPLRPGPVPARGAGGFRAQGFRRRERLRRLQGSDLAQRRADGALSAQRRLGQFARRGGLLRHARHRSRALVSQGRGWKRREIQRSAGKIPRQCQCEGSPLRPAPASGRAFRSATSTRWRPFCGP